MFTQVSSAPFTSPFVPALPTINVDDNESASVKIEVHDFLNNLLNGGLNRDQRLYFYGNRFFDNLRELSYIEYNYDDDQSGVKNFIAKAAFKSLWEDGMRNGKVNNRLVMQILGHVTEALVVRNCKKYPFTNRNYLAVALKRNIEEVTLAEYMYCRAIGTGLKTTSLEYPMYYNPNDTQMDVKWVNINNNDLVYYDYVTIDNQNSIITAKPAGLQIKASIYGLGRVLYDLLNGRYIVPVIYFGVNNDYYQIVERTCQWRYEKDKNLQQKVFEYIYKLIRPAADVDSAGYREFLYYYEMLTDWAAHEISIDDLIRYANDPTFTANSPTLKKSLMSFAVSKNTENSRTTIQC